MQNEFTLMHTRETVDNGPLTLCASERLATGVQIHQLVRGLCLAAPDHRPAPVDGKSPALLPLVAYGARGTEAVVRLGACPRPRLRRGGGGGGGTITTLLDGGGDARAQPALLLPGGGLGGRVEVVPDTREAEAPGGVDGAVLVDDDLDVPGAADQVEPLLRGGGRRVRDGDAGEAVALVGGGELAEGEEGLLGNCMFLPTVSLVADTHV